MSGGLVSRYWTSIRARRRKVFQAGAFGRLHRGQKGFLSGGFSHASNSHAQFHRHPSFPDAVFFSSDRARSEKPGRVLIRPARAYGIAKLPEHGFQKMVQTYRVGLGPQAIQGEETAWACRVGQEVTWKCRTWP